MLDILAITGPIYVVIALGYGAVRRGLFSPDELRVLGRFVITLALPALLFNALAHRPVAEILNPVYLAAYAAGSIAVVLAAFAFARRVRRRSAPESAFIAMGMGFSNTGFVGYPIVLQFLGPPAAVALALSMIVENLLVLPLTLALAESGGGDGARWHRALAQSLRRLAVNPLILAIVAGFVVALAGLALPSPLTRTIDLFAQASTAVALFVIGGSLAGLEVRGMVRDVAAIAVGKLVAHPLAVIAVLALLPPLDPTLRLACIAFACMPMLSVYPILAQRHRLEGLCSAALLVTTVASFFTISTILWLVGPIR
jgi:predicted permease